MREPTLHELDARQERFALARASGLNVKTAARAACVSSETGARWGGLQAVKRRIADLTREIQERAVEKIAADVAAAAKGGE